MEPSTSYYAHSPNAKGERHLLADHLRATAELARQFSEAFGGEAEAFLAGLLHDLGKYGDLFQRRLRGEEHGIDHWSLGAWVALTQHRNPAVALAVQGHHLGLQQLTKDTLLEMDARRLGESHPLKLRLSEASPEAVLSRLHGDGLSMPEVTPTCYGPRIRTTASAMLDVRMLFSALVDADHTNTAAHFEPVGSDTARFAGEGTPLCPDHALRVLLDHVRHLAAKSTAAPRVNAMRADLLEACLQAATASPGVWTLSAPTGAGKTLGMLAFALRHAQEYGLRRIVMVIPYLSVIEQTADTYRRILCPHFGDDYVLEHHSLSETKRTPCTATEGGDDEEEGSRRLRSLTERWEAPLVVTTSVQVLESLFASRPSPCRKLHRLAESVILFDEVQTIPEHLAVATLTALAWLAERYRSSVVFATATQPAFTHLDKAVRNMGDAGWKPREIVPSRLRLYDRARRTRVSWPDPEEATPWRDLAEQLAEADQVLCIVNLKSHARDLARDLYAQGVEGVYHLSTAMCPAHRRAMLRLVRGRLNRDQPCHLISTQCVEAGVDIDFPLVYRALAPLEGIAQAAGRCNRNGARACGEVRVFVPEDHPFPPLGGGYKQATGLVAALLRQRGPEKLDLDDPALFSDYYRRFYDLAQTETSSPELREAILLQDFPRVAELYQLIKQDTFNVLVPYHAGRFAKLAQEVRARGLAADWIRRAQPYTVGEYRSRDSALSVYLESVPVTGALLSTDWFIYTGASTDYSRLFGLSSERTLGTAII